MFGVGQVAFRGGAEGSLVRGTNGQVVGCLIGQAFDAPEYFWGRPSAAGDGYDAGASGASTGPTSKELADAVQERVDALLAAHPGATTADIPGELVTASGSGLDPDISPAGGRLPGRPGGRRPPARPGQGPRAGPRAYPGSRPGVPGRAEGERARAQPGPRYCLRPMTELGTA